jgi:hypothetical protein
VDWILLAKDGIWLRALVNMVMNPRFHKVQGISARARQLLASQGAACSMQLFVVSFTIFFFFETIFSVWLIVNESQENRFCMQYDVCTVMGFETMGFPLR